ncbi:MAG: AbrB/MazE/SpoVT family DNA-binding domain-containing protein [Defluviitaleaceae bacterium]|nr:AbrB/MazE/SpoVT family DNA-binding domain-containing protein [Defluviitaleaceae bacterium]
MVTQVAKWGNSQGIRMDKRMLSNLGLCIGDTVEIQKNGENIIVKPTHGIDWYLQDYERPTPAEDWEHVESKGREEW